MRLSGCCIIDHTFDKENVSLWQVKNAIWFALITHYAYGNTMKTLFLTLALLILTPSMSMAEEPTYIVGIPCNDSQGCSTPDGEAVLSELYDRVGIQVTFQYLPMARDIYSSNNSIIDASMARSLHVIAQLENLVPVKEPFLELRYFMLTRTSDMSEKSGNLTVAYLGGDIIGERLARKMSPTPHRVNLPKSGINMVQSKRVDAFISDHSTLDENKKLIEEGLLKMGGPIHTEVLYHAVIQRHTSLVPKLEKALCSMKKDGSFKKLMGRLSLMIPTE